MALIVLPGLDAVGKRKPTLMNEDIYKVILQITLGNFSKPVKERSTVERSAIVHHYRYRGRWSAQGSPPTLYLGKQHIIFVQQACM